MHDAARGAERLGGLPGGAELLALARERARTSRSSAAPCATCCSGAAPRELDVVVAGDAGGLRRRARRGDARRARARRARRSSTPCTSASGPPSVVWRGGRIDVAERRAESYPAPGALPEVRPGSVEEDLRRRDFTVNAIAAAAAAAGRAGSWSRVDARARGPRGGAAARAARAQLPRRPHPPAAPRPLRAPGWASRSSRTPPSSPRDGRSRRARWRRSPAARVGAELRLALRRAGRRSRALRGARRARRARRAGLPAALRRELAAARAARCCPPTARPELLLALRRRLPPARRRADEAHATLQRAARRLEFAAGDARPGARGRARRVALADARCAGADARPRSCATLLARPRRRGASRSPARSRRRRARRRRGARLREWLDRAAPRAPGDHRRRPARGRASPQGPEIGDAPGRRRSRRKLDGELDGRAARRSCSAALEAGV